MATRPSVNEAAERLRISVYTLRYLEAGRPIRACGEDRPTAVLGREGPGQLQLLDQKGATVSVQRLVTQGGRVSYRARVKSHGREVATKCFERRADAVAWVSDQTRRIRTGDWVDPRRGRVSMGMVADGWLDSRASVKRRTRETDLATWANYVQPTFGNRADRDDHHRRGFGVAGEPRCERSGAQYRASGAGCHPGDP